MGELLKRPGVKNNYYDNFTLKYVFYIIYK